MFIGIYVQQISGERLQDHWSSGFFFCNIFSPRMFLLVKISCIKTGKYLLILCIIYNKFRLFSDFETFKENLSPLALYISIYIVIWIRERYFSV